MATISTAETHRRNGIASALRHVAAGDRVGSHQRRSRTPEWREGYAWALAQVGDLRHHEGFCNALAPLVAGVYECNKTEARRCIASARKETKCNQ